MPIVTDRGGDEKDGAKGFRTRAHHSNRQGSALSTNATNACVAGQRASNPSQVQRRSASLGVTRSLPELDVVSKLSETFGRETDAPICHGALGRYFIK